MVVKLRYVSTGTSPQYVDFKTRNGAPSPACPPSVRPPPPRLPDSPTSQPVAARPSPLLYLDFDRAAHDIGMGNEIQYVNSGRDRLLLPGVLPQHPEHNDHATV